MNAIQFKLTNGDEILCEVIQEPIDDEINLIVRNAMKIITIDRHEEGYRFYSFRPWMVYQDREDHLQLINYTHIVGEAKPHKQLYDQYKLAIEQERKLTSGRDGDDSTEDDRQKFYESLEEAELDNVIKFKDKDKLH